MKDRYDYQIEREVRRQRQGGNAPRVVTKQSAGNVESLIRRSRRRAVTPVSNVAPDNGNLIVLGVTPFIGYYFGTRPAFTPLAEDMLVAWWKIGDASTLFQDTAGTIPVTQTGDAVRLVRDKSGNNNHLTPVSTPSPSFLEAGGAGEAQPTLLFSGSGTDRMVSPSFLDSTFNQALSWFAVVHGYSSNSTRVYMGHGGNLWYAARTANELISNHSGLAGGFNNRVGHNNTDLYNWGLNIDGETYDGETWRLFNSGAYRDRTPLAPDLGLSGALTVGSHHDGTLAWPFRVAEVMICKKGLSLDRARAYIGYLATEHSKVPRSSAESEYRVVFDGDSLTAGTAAGGLSESYPAKLYELYGSYYWHRYWNFGLDGQKLQTMLSGATGKVDPVALASSQLNISVIWGGINDWNQGRTVAQAKADFDSYVTARFAAGFDAVIALTLTPSTGTGFTAAYETFRQDFNAHVRSQAGVLGHLVADVGADSRIGDLGDQLNRTYYTNDDLHLNSAGNVVVAELVKEQLDIALGL